MDLGRRSNTGALLAAVAVGLLGLYVNQYGWIPRSVIARLRAHLLPAADPLEQPLDFQQEAPLSPPEAMNRLKEIENELIELLERAKRHGTTTRDRRRMDYLYQQTRYALTQLDTGKATDSQRHSGQVSYFTIAFLLAEIEPARFSKLFLELDEPPVAPEDHSSPVRMAGLRLYHQLRLGRLSEQQLLDRLREIRQSHPDDPDDPDWIIGIQLHSLVADELYRRHNDVLAEQVLRHGIHDYAQHRGVSRLIMQLSQRQHDEPGPGH